MTRRILSILVGFLVLLASVFILTMVLETVWPSSVARTLKSPIWFVWALLLAIVHALCGALSGYIATAVSRESRLLVGYLLSGVTFVYLVLQILGEWGHPFRFFWNLVLIGITVAGVVVGASVRLGRVRQGSS